MAGLYRCYDTKWQPNGTSGVIFIKSVSQWTEFFKIVESLIFQENNKGKVLYVFRTIIVM